MATQTCPRCQQAGFTWHIDDEASDLTIWGCHKCHYQAVENEADERICNTCGSKNETKLIDDEKVYWWCSNCNIIELIKS